tara:strand:+ start:14412 stop:14852 length:441 start_codon:yes stop_codon:yes gene_type:complete
MPQAPEGTIFHIGKARKEVSIKNAPEELLSRLMYCKDLDEAIDKEYNIKKAMRLTRENIDEIARKLGIEVEITNLMGAGAETLSLRMLDRKGVKLIVSEDIEREDFNIMDIYYKQFTHITGAGMFTGGDLKPEGVLMAEECFLLLG